jgi:hypothetical protein
MAGKLVRLAVEFGIGQLFLPEYDCDFVRCFGGLFLKQLMDAAIRDVKQVREICASWQHQKYLWSGCLLILKPCWQLRKLPALFTPA